MFIQLMFFKFFFHESNLRVILKANKIRYSELIMYTIKTVQKNLYTHKQK